MRITRIETAVSPENMVVVVRVGTDTGLEGLGQTAPRHADITAAVLHALVAPLFLGQNPWDHQQLVDRCLRTHYKFTGSFLYRALCGVETALWDLLGQATGQPVHALLGGAARTSIPMYASSMSREIGPEDEAARLAGLVQRDGFRGVKIKIGGRMGRDTDASSGRTERLIVAMREAVGPDIAINADANGAYTAHKAIAIGRLLEAHSYHHFEEPCPFPEWENTAAVAAALDIPVAVGEQDNDLHDFARMIANRTMDIVQLDVGYIGGIGRAARVAAMADTAGRPCTPHCANHSLLQVFTLHLAAAMPACHDLQEWHADPDAAWESFYEPRLRVVDGAVAVPTRPGWGVTLVPGFLDRATTRLVAE